MIALVVHRSTGFVVNAIVVEDESSVTIDDCDVVERPTTPDGVWIGWVRSGTEWIAPIGDE